MKRKFTFLMLLAAMVCWPAMQMNGQNRLQLSFVNEEGSTVRQAEATLGEAFTAPRLVFEPAEAERVVRVEYSSTYPDIAEVDARGQVTLKAAGTTTITAVSGQTEEYYTARAQYDLIVNAKQDTTPVVPVTCPEAYFFVNGAMVTSLSLKVGESVSVPMLLTATGGIISGGRITTQDSKVAIVSADNMIYGMGEGTTTLFVSTYMSEDGGAGSVLTCDYPLTLIVEAAAPAKQNPELSWSDTAVYAELGVPVEAPVLYNPHNVPMNKIESQNPNVAEISEDGKVLTIKGVGKALIFAESFDTEEYYAQSVSYTVYVSTIGLKVKGINVTSANAADVLGDGSYNVTFEVASRTLHLNSWNIDATGLTGLNEMIEDEGTTIPLTIMLHGANSISNVPVCIKAEQVPVVVMGQSMRDTWNLSASQIAVNTKLFKIHQCDVSAEAPLAAVKLGNELGVSKNSHLLATSTGLAIQCQTLVMAEGEEGVAILTPGVRFEPMKGFLTAENQYAKEVEIGKVPVVVPADEVTTIDFTATDPEGNESVVFSASADDTYNVETGQLEIATSLTDEAVEQALEELVPGSSAWIDLLPGSLVFDIPAGKGKVRVQCMTLAGYTLQLKIEGQAVVSIEQTELGWAEVTYDVQEPIHVVIYLHAQSGSHAPARIATAVKDADPTVGAFIQAVEIVPADAPVTGIERVEPAHEGAQKILRNGVLYILRGEHIYTVEGLEI